MAQDQVLDIPMQDIFCDDEFNSRGHINSADVMDLAKDIKAQGLLQPITVMPWKGDRPYRIVCGHRRYTAHLLNKCPTIPCLVKKNLTEEQALIANVSENLKRKDLTIVQEANVCARFRNLRWNDQRIAEQLGVSKQWVTLRLVLLTLPEDIQKRAEAGLLTQHQIDEISKKPTLEEKYALTRKCIDWKLKGERGSFKEDTVEKAAARLAKTGETRNKTEMLAMQQHIQESFKYDGHFGARVLAWAMGVISNEDLYSDVERLATAAGLRYRKPAA